MQQKANELRRREIAAGISIFLGFTAIGSHAAIVTQCGDKPADTHNLRNSVVSTGAGGTVTFNLPGTCSLIVLSSAIPIPKPSLTIAGPGRDKLAISTYDPSGPTIHLDRIFNHTGSGTLTVTDLKIDHGYVQSTSSGSQAGGCIASSSNVELDRVDVDHCAVVVAAQVGVNARGGGVYAKGNLTLHQSTITNNVAYGGININSFGGGAAVGGLLAMQDSTVSGNFALSKDPNNASGHGGGLYTASHADTGPASASTITGSTISGNTADYQAGGIESHSYLVLKNSTISGNHAIGNTGAVAPAGYVGGALLAQDARLYNSTIADNTSYTQAPSIALGAAGIFSPGLTATAIGPVTTTLQLQSTLVSNNTFSSLGQVPDDLGEVATNTPGNMGTVIIASASAKNLVRKDNGLMPTGQGNLINVCPLLGLLAANNGITMTHALLSGSPGINVGNNVSTPTLSYDQRGSAATNGLMDFLRSSNGVPDIGAYEVQATDVVFNAGFDSCP